LGTARLAADSANVVVVLIEGALTAGPYTVRWRGTGADGHPVRGEFAFTIEQDAAGLVTAEQEAVPVSTPPPAEHHSAASFPEGNGFGAESPGYVVVRWLTFLGLLGVIGVAAFRLLVLGLVRRQGAPEGLALIDSAAVRAARLGVWFALLLAVATAARLYAQSYAMHGAENVLGASGVGAMLGRTVWGWGWMLQAGAALVALSGFVLARRQLSAGWALAVLGALALAFTPGLSGHAAATPGLAIPAVLADAAHVLGPRRGSSGKGAAVRV
jgi:hypothetical protein